MNKPTRTEAIKRFLIAKTVQDFADNYNHDMEVQVNVARDGGERIEKEYQGRLWQGWTDGIQTWKPFRIPYKDVTYTDVPMSFDLVKHVEGIGMTGWDWVAKRSKWVGFDFDSIINHSSGLSSAELEEIIRLVKNIPWVTIRYSTSGHGYHLYVNLNIKTNNHDEHAALARAVLGKMSALTGYDFRSKVDACGGNMWVWHRKMTGDGLKIIKEGKLLLDVPINWPDHVPVITGKRNKVLPSLVSDPNEQLFQELTSQRVTIPLDVEHKRLIDQLHDGWYWCSDHHALVTHTYVLQQAHKDLGYKGVYKTISPGTNLVENNCFAHPLRKGAWVIRRFTPGVNETDTWFQDTAGWTTCYFNQDPDLKTAARAFGGVEDTDNGFVFREAEVAIEAAKLLGITFDVPTWARAGRETKLKENKDGRLIIEIAHDSRDPSSNEFSKWLVKKGKWTRIFDTRVSPTIETDTGNYDDVVRHLITESNDDLGWVIQHSGSWITEPLIHVRTFLQGMGLASKDVTKVLGNCISRCWTVVNQPFQPEYPGDRQWNRKAIQLAYAPSHGGNYPTWLTVLDHIGQSLDNALSQNEWAVENHIIHGSDYLKVWIASLVQYPLEPLPYLFLWGNQNCGKSILHEALDLLFTSGVELAKQALESQGGFTGELENALLCVVEELDLKRNKVAYNRIKDFVTSRKISIHRKGLTPYSIINKTHWIHTSNEADSCPVFPGDSRITMIYVPDLEEIIPKREIIVKLQKEAPDFLGELLTLDIPVARDRLNIPILDTEDKKAAQQANRTLLEEWLEDHCYYVPGEWIKYRELYDRFKDWLDPNHQFEWTIIRFGKELPKHKFPKGRSPKDAQYYVGNISFSAKEGGSCKYKLIKEMLMLS